MKKVTQRQNITQVLLEHNPTLAPEFWISVIIITISWHQWLIYLLWDIRLLRSSTVTNLFQSWVPGVTSLKMYSAPTIAAAYDKAVWLIVVITNEPPGWNIKFKQIIKKGFGKMMWQYYSRWENDFPCSGERLEFKVSLRNIPTQYKCICLFSSVPMQNMLRLTC